MELSKKLIEKLDRFKKLIDQVILGAKFDAPEFETGVVMTEVVSKNGTIHGLILNPNTADQVPEVLAVIVSEEVVAQLGLNLELRKGDVKLYHQSGSEQTLVACTCPNCSRGLFDECAYEPAIAANAPVSNKVH